MTANEPPAGGKRARWRDWYVAVVVALGAVYCFGPSLVGARTLLSVNSLSNFLPWETAGNESFGHELCQSDTVDSVVPTAAYVRHQVYGGHLGSWQSLQSGGGPLASLPNGGMLDPLSLPYWILPLRWAPAFSVLLCWVAAIGGTFLFLRRLEVSRAGATLAGFAFATSGFMVMWSNWPQSRTAALIPALFWATERLATRARSGDVALLGGVVASMLFGGFPQVTAFALYMASAYFLGRLLFLHPVDWRAAGSLLLRGASGVALGVAVSALQLIPFIDFYRTDSLAYRSDYAKGGLPLSGLMTVFAPNSNGLCLVGRPDHSPFNPVETVAYVGAAALVLAVVGGVFPRLGFRITGRGGLGGTRRFFAAAVVLAIVLGCASPTARSAVSALPGFADNFIGRIRSVAGFGLAVLVGLGFDRVTWRPAWSRLQRLVARPDGQVVWARLWSIGMLGAVVAAAVLVWQAGARDARSGHYSGDWQAAVLVPTVLLAISVAVAAAAVSRPLRAVAFVVLPLLVVGQGVQFFTTVMPGDDPANFYPDTGDHAFLAAHLAHDRFASGGLMLYPATAFYFGLRSATGHQFTDPRWNDLLQAVDPTVMISPTDSDFVGALDQRNIADQPILDEMGVEYFVLPPVDLAGVGPLVRPGGGTTDPSTEPACPLAGGPLRGVRVRLGGALEQASRRVGVTVRMTLTAPGFSRSSGIFLGGSQPAGSDVSIPVAGEDLPSGRPITASFSVTGSSTPLVLSGAGAAATCSPVVPSDDGLKLVYAAPGAVIYQRLTALPRIRWDSSAEVVPGRAGQIGLLSRGLPPSTVLLSGPGPAGDGQAAQVQVTADDGDRISAKVRAAGRGYLVVADSMDVPGWSVSVDGRPAVLRQADYAMVAVAVPEGAHTVTFSYRAPGQVQGAALTFDGLLVGAGLVWWELYGPIPVRLIPMGRGPGRRRRPRLGLGGGHVPRHRRRRGRRRPAGGA